MTLVDDIRNACAWVAAQAVHVRIVEDAIPAYAAALPLASELPGLDPDVHPLDGSVEERAAFFLTLDAINFGSGWFPTLRKRAGRSGYFTIALGLRDRDMGRPLGDPRTALTDLVDERHGSQLTFTS